MMNFEDISVKILKEEGFTGTYEIAPLKSGYGNTLANTLRRILLSSLPGAGVTSIKITGVEHEYSTIEGIKEDIVEIILNVKSLRLKSHSSEPQTCYIQVSGKKVVTGADIQVSGGVEVMTKDTVIATLTDSSSSFSMELVVERGVGYRQAEENDRSEMGRIPLDTDFSPIKNVKYEVVNARKGQETELDGVLIDITTDGSIAPKEALIESCKILQDFAGKVMIALGISKKDVEEMAEASSVIPEVEVGSTNSATDNSEIRSWKIEDLPLSKRAKSGLLAGGFNTVADLEKISIEDLLSLSGFGSKSLDEVTDLLSQYGIEIKK